MPQGNSFSTQYWLQVKHKWCLVAREIQIFMPNVASIPGLHTSPLVDTVAVMSECAVSRTWIHKSRFELHLETERWQAVPCGTQPNLFVFSHLDLCSSHRAGLVQNSNQPVQTAAASSSFSPFVASPTYIPPPPPPSPQGCLWLFTYIF